MEYNKYTFTNDWFENSEIKKISNKYLKNTNINKILEIGSHDGASACYFSDNFLDVYGSSLICVDPFDISDSTSPVSINTYSNFVNNVLKSNNWQKIKLKQMKSINFFNENKDMFSFIYIDGSHLVKDIENDFVESLKIIEMDGIIWLDDYSSSQPVSNIIDKIYEENKTKLKIIHKGYQIAFKKIS